MPRFNIQFEPLPSPNSQLVRDWGEAIKNTYQKPYTFPTVDEVPEDLVPLVKKIRSELELRGINPNTVYPVAIGTDKEHTMENLTITLEYVTSEKTNG